MFHVKHAELRILVAREPRGTEFRTLGACSGSVCALEDRPAGINTSVSLPVVIAEKPHGGHPFAGSRVMGAHVSRETAQITPRSFGLLMSCSEGLSAHRKH